MLLLVLDSRASEYRACLRQHVQTANPSGPQVGMASASAPATPRSGAASESNVAGHKKKASLFKGLRRKGQRPNQVLR